MGIDLNFWKYESGTYLDNALVYQKACCNHEKIEGLDALPIEDILNEIAVAFHGWDSCDRFNYEKKEGQGSFQISATPQTVRLDCYSMEQADMKRFSVIMSKFGCPLYDPQQGVRFDKIAAFLIDEAGEYESQAAHEFSRLLPHLEVITQAVSWDEYVRLSKEIKHIQYNAIIHRGEKLTKVTSFMQFGNAWASRPCQCKTAQLAEKDQARKLLEELLQKSMERVVNDFRERTYYESFCAPYLYKMRL